MNKDILKSMAGVVLICFCVITGFVIFYFTAINRNIKANIISTKGMSEKEFVSDLAIWTVTISDNFDSLKKGVEEIQRQTDKFLFFLNNNSVSRDQIKLEGIQYSKRIESFYDSQFKEWIQKERGYHIEQTITITGKDIDLIDNLATSSSSLVTDGVMINSQSPRFYYTKLSELKKELLSEASKDAYNRAKEIASGSNAKIGKLKLAKMGVFQILGKYTNEEYSWGGTFNTSSKEKKAVITVSAEYIIE